MSATRLIVTLDVERDYGPHWKTPPSLTFRSVLEALPYRLGPVMADFGIRPTYFLSPEVILDVECCDALRTFSDAELAAHLHGDYLVPQIKSWDFANPQVRVEDMQCDYPPDLEREKLAVLTELFGQQFGHRPVSFRAGRFGIGHDTGRWLIELGYSVDSSVTPHIVWNRAHRAAGPDFRGCPERPYTVTTDGDLWKPGDSHFLEVPLTILEAGAIAGRTSDAPRWFRPWYSDEEALIAIMHRVAAESPQQGRQRPLVMMFRSVELVPGASPSPQTEADVERYLDTLKRVFQHAEELGIKSCTLQEYYHEYMAWKETPAAARAPLTPPMIEVSLPKAAEPLKKDISLPADLVEPILDQYQVQPWFQYIYRERATRWDVWQPCFWVAQQYPPDAAVLSTGCGVGFNLMWLAEHGFRQLYGFDIDDKAIAAGVEICHRAKLPIHLWVDDALNPQQLPQRRFSVIECLNWTMLIPNLSVGALVEKYLPYLAEEGVLLLDSIDVSYNEVPNNQYLTSDWGNPIAQRRPSEYKTRIPEAELRSMLQSQGLTIAETFCEEQIIPRRVYVIRRAEVMQDSEQAPQVDPQQHPKPSAARTSRPRILLITDVPDWIFARHCRMLQRYLAEDFDFTVIVQDQPYDEEAFDLIYPLEWNLVKPEQIRQPHKYVTGIRSHLGWPELDFFAFVDYLNTHFQRVHVVSKRLYRIFAPFLPQVTYTTHGVDTSFFTPTTRADQSGQQVRLGWAGNRKSAEDKGFHDIIEPLGRLPGVELVFCGYSDANLSLEDMRRFYDSIDIYVCASVNEGNNNALLEAAAMERAIITTDNGTVPEYLRHGESALVVERHLPLFIQAVQELRDDPAKRVALGKQAREALLNGWDWKDKAETFRSFFQEAVEAQVRRPITAETAPDGHPKVSVIVPTFNRPDMLQIALTSILNQSFQNFEIIVINDGGEDVESLIASMNQHGNIIYVRHEKNRGLAASRNTGIKLASGKYIAYLDDDDRFLPEHLETMVDFLEAHEQDYKVAYTDAWRVHQTLEQGQYVETGRDVPYSFDFDADRLLVRNYFPVLCVMHQRACLDQAGLFDESLTSHEDWDLWIRMSRAYHFAHIKKTTAEFTWRTDRTSMSSRMRPDYIRTTEVIYQKYRDLVATNPTLRRAQERHLEAVRGRNTPPDFECSIIIPVWNKVELTRQCLSHLAAVTRHVHYEVIVVDNASTDETPAFLAMLSGDVRVITNGENLGFAKACNQGAQAAKGRYLVFLNNDTIPLEGWLEAMVEEVKAHPDVAVVGSKLLYPDGTIQHAGVAFTRANSLPYHVYRGLAADVSVVNRRREFQVVTAACMLVRREVFEAVGRFDEGYRNGFEDVDLCLKIRDRGGRVVYQPKSVLYHLESQTPGRKDHDEANARRLLERWGHHWLTDEDAVCVPDGLAIQTKWEKGRPYQWFIGLKDLRDRDRWELVAEVQRLLLAGQDDAVRPLLSRIEAWPDDAGVLSWAGQVSDRLGELAYAEPFWRRALNFGETPDALAGLVRLTIERGALDEAERYLTALLAHADGEGALLQGILAIQREDYRAATAAFEMALKHGASPRKARLGVGMAAMAQGQIEKAWEAFAAVLTDDIDDAEAMHCLLRAGTALERWQPLTEYLSSYLKLNPGDLSVRFALAGVQIRRGEWDAAREHYDMIRLLEPTFAGLDDLAQLLERQTSSVGA
jgi:GT2 family glycosyltransferase/glycosyltransferase involved in cell wall biosynthesis/thioredoxin-like negative regulator of GroEL/2-polyprenyl-3-methyl-5-hydroxy-6-metoxy-1,4-benzoquinol methylase